MARRVEVVKIRRLQLVRLVERAHDLRVGRAVDGERPVHVAVAHVEAGLPWLAQLPADVVDADAAVLAVVEDADY